MFELNTSDKVILKCSCYCKPVPLICILDQLGHIEIVLHHMSNLLNEHFKTNKVTQMRDKSLLFLPHCPSSSSLPSVHSRSPSQTQVLGMQWGTPLLQPNSSLVHVILTEKPFTLSKKKKIFQFLNHVIYLPLICSIPFQNFSHFWKCQR